MTLLPRHYDELAFGSSIAPEVIAARGYESITPEQALARGYAPSQARAGLFMPTHTLAGVQIGGLLKPDEPRTDDRGRRLKYEAAVDSVPMLDIHPGARHLLEDPTQPLWFTEGHKKADAAWSRGLPCVALTGVYMFLHQRYVVPDLDEINLRGRDCRIAFDSDATRKQSVADARLRFAEALRRRGAKVSVVYLPEGHDGAKVGLDDFFAAGGTVAELEALTKPWDGNGPGIWIRSAGDADPAELSATCTALMQAILNPENTRADLMLMAATASLAMHKRSRGETEPDGRVVLNAAEIADDYRPAPEPGERVAPLNPAGTKPRMARSTVKAAMAKAVESGRLQARPREVTRTHRNGTQYRDTEWTIAPSASFAELIDPWARYRLTEPKTRKPRTATPPCPHCGEVHPIRQRDYCEGCGGLLAERSIAPKFADDSASDNVSEVANEERPTVPAPSSLVPSFIGGEADQIGDLASDNLSQPRRPTRRDADGRIGVAGVPGRVLTARDDWNRRERDHPSHPPDVDLSCAGLGGPESTPTIRPPARQPGLFGTGVPDRYTDPLLSATG
jgi:hypothetical protein